MLVSLIAKRYLFIQSRLETLVPIYVWKLTDTFLDNVGNTLII